MRPKVDDKDFCAQTPVHRSLCNREGWLDFDRMRTDSSADRTRIRPLFGGTR